MAAGLTRHYPGAASPALDGVSFEVGTGEVVGLLGPNGAGKSTLVKLVCGVSRPSSGHLQVFGRDPASPRAKQEVAAVHQGSPFDQLLPVLDNLKNTAGFRGLRWPAVRDRAHELLAAFGLAGRTKDLVFTLSGGELRRLQVVRALLAPPRLLLLDEPSAGLDVTGRRQVWDLILGLVAEHGTTVVWTSHYLEELERHCGRVLVLDRGRVLRYDTPAALIGADGTLEEAYVRLIGR